jgi:hypothetical protein
MQSVPSPVRFRALSSAIASKVSFLSLPNNNSALWVCLCPLLKSFWQNLGLPAAPVMPLRRYCFAGVSHFEACRLELNVQLGAFCLWNPEVPLIVSMGFGRSPVCLGRFFWSAACGVWSRSALALCIPVVLYGSCSNKKCNLAYSWLRYRVEGPAVQSVRSPVQIWTPPLSCCRSFLEFDFWDREIWSYVWPWNSKQQGTHPDRRGGAIGNKFQCVFLGGASTPMQGVVTSVSGNISGRSLFLA